MQCPECGLQLSGAESVCPRCLTRLATPIRTEVLEELVAEGQSTDGRRDRTRTPRPPEAIPEWSSTRWEDAQYRSGPSRAPLILTLVLFVAGVAIFGLLFISVIRRGVDYYLEQAQAYRQNGQFELALSAYLRVLSREPDLATAENGVGWSYLGMGQPDMAIAHLQQAATLDPQLLEAHRGLGIAYSDVHMWPEAEASLRKALALERDDAQAGRYLGYVYYQEQRYDEAIEVLSAVTRKHVELTEAQEYLGRALYEMGRYDEALGPLRRAVEQDPDAASARQYLGLVAYELGRCDWALEQFDYLRAAEPGNPTWYAHTGQCLYREGDYQAAISNLNHALVLSRADPVLNDSHLYLGWAYYEQERYTEAELMFRRALVMDPQEPKAMAGLGWCYVQLERCQDATPLFEEALDLDPYLVSARDGLAACVEEPE